MSVQSGFEVASEWLRSDDGKARRRMDYFDHLKKKGLTVVSRREALLSGDRERAGQGVKKGVSKGVRREALGLQQIKEVVEKVIELYEACASDICDVRACIVLHYYTRFLSSLRHLHSTISTFSIVSWPHHRPDLSLHQL